MLAILVILFLAAILLPLALRSQNKNLLLEESGRMRKVYVGMAAYSEQWDNQPPPSLVPTLPMIGDRETYTSAFDPYKDLKSSTFPADPGLPSFESSTFRIGFSYIENFRRSGKLKIDPWKEMGLTDNHGVLANEWLGSVEPGTPPQAKVSGKVMRILQDGSVYMLSDRGGPKDLGDPQDLFFRK